MGNVIEFPVGKQIEHANRESARSMVIDTQDEAIAALEILWHAAVKVREIPSEVLDSVMISRDYTMRKPRDTETMLMAVAYEIGKALVFLDEYRANKQQPNQTER